MSRSTNETPEGAKIVFAMASSASTHEASTTGTPSSAAIETTTGKTQLSCARPGIGASSAMPRINDIPMAARTPKTLSGGRLTLRRDPRARP